MNSRVRKGVTTITDLVFPTSKYINDDQKSYLMRTGHDYITSLPLQMSLYFNCFFSPIWLIISIVMLVTKYGSLETLYQIIIIAILAVMMIVESIRLYLGYIGNLQEQVPELSGFWLLTLLLQLPLILLLLFFEPLIILPLERAANIVMSLFIVFQVICGFFAIRNMTNYQATKFHLKQFMNLERINDIYPQDNSHIPTNHQEHLHSS